MTTKLTPPQLARRWGISPDKVLAWIRAGELRAIDACTKLGGRPRYLIDERDIAEFEGRRSSTRQEPCLRRQQGLQNGITQFF